MKTVRLKTYIQGLGHPGDTVAVTADYAARLVARGLAEPTAPTEEDGHAPDVPAGG